MAWTTCSSDLVPFASSTAVRTAGADSLEPSVANRILVGKMIIAFCLTRPVTLRSYELASSSLLRTPPFPSTSLAHARSISGILRSPWHLCRNLSQRDPGERRWRSGEPPSPVFPVSFRERFATLDRMLSSMPCFRVSTSPEVRRIASEMSI